MRRFNARSLRRPRTAARHTLRITILHAYNRRNWSNFEVPFWKFFGGWKQLQNVILQFRFTADVELGIYDLRHVFYAADAHAKPFGGLRIGEIVGEETGEMVLAVGENGGCA